MLKGTADVKFSSYQMDEATILEFHSRVNEFIGSGKIAPLHESHKLGPFTPVDKIFHVGTSLRNFSRNQEIQ